jgi:GNAT superfamily N-acetyltransferase
MLDLTIREAEEADVPEIVRLLLEDDLGSQREATDEGVLDSYYEAMRAITAVPGNRVLVAEQGGRLIGTFQLIIIPSLSFQGGKRAQIESVRVDRALRGQGIGRLLMEWALEAARAEGCVLVQLSTHKSRHRAHHFYEQLGFTASHEGMKLMLNQQ